MITDANMATKPGTYLVKAGLHQPTVGDWYVIKVVSSSKDSFVQLAYDLTVNSNTQWFRKFSENTWTSWAKTTTNSDLIPLTTIENCNNAFPSYLKVRMYHIAWGFNMPVSGNHNFTIYTCPAGADELNYHTQIAICTRSEIAANVGKIYTRSCIGGTYGGWVEK